MVYLVRFGKPWVSKWLRTPTTALECQPTMAPKVKLYTAGTPNGQKINIALEELGIDYEVYKIDIAKNVQKEPWFLEINRS